MQYIAMIIGAGDSGVALLKALRDLKSICLGVIIDENINAPGIQLAIKEGIPYGPDWKRYLFSQKYDIIFDVSGDEEIYKDLQKYAKSSVVVSGTAASMVVTMLEEKEKLIGRLRYKVFKNGLTFESFRNGVMITDHTGKITVFNKAAEQLSGLEQEQVIGKSVKNLFPQSEILLTLKTKKPRVHRQFIFPNGQKAVLSVIPLMDNQETFHGICSVFENMDSFLEFANHITKATELQSLLETVIYTSIDAISVVDEQGKGLAINPAYKRMTGLTEKEITGKIPTLDIYKGESLHMHVLRTKKPLRGVRMFVGPGQKEVEVNVSPVLVDDQIKGSVGILHDMSEIRELTDELEKAQERIRLKEAKYTFADIACDTEEMKEAVNQARIGANTPACILLMGEPGTGKDLFAHAIHNESNRKDEKFIRFDCAQISDFLLERVWFGYEKDVFSGTGRRGNKGLYEKANNGSIFLDKIDELSLDGQEKLLRVLRGRKIYRIGGTESVPINVKIMAATNRDLEREVERGNFLEDLYLLLNRIPVCIPPLRERLNDIPLLCKSLIAKLNHEYGKNVSGISADAIRLLQTYNWPGNVRELENVLGRAISIMRAYEKVIKIGHLPPLEHNPGTGPETVNHHSMDSTPLYLLMEQYEKKIILYTLKKNGGNKTKTADELGISIRSLYYKLNRYL